MKHAWARQKASIAQGCLTNSKHPRCFVQGVYPTHIVSAAECFVKGANNVRYMDYICGLGSILLGYDAEGVIREVSKRLRGGFSHSLPTETEVVAAEKIKEMFTFVEKVKFLKTGSGACTGALTIARAATGRKEVLSEGYHGFHDEFTSLTPPANGVVADYKIKKLLDVNDITKETAAVIVEPVITDTSNERINWLRDLRRKCTSTGTVLIFDEIITSFRFRNHGVANFYGIIPDLLIIGKAMANGLPLSAICGRADVMDGDYFISTTFAGEVLSLGACIGVIDTLLQRERFKVNSLVTHGKQFCRGFNSFWPELQIEGYETRGVLKAEPLIKALFMQEACRAGLLFGPSWFYMFPHFRYNDTTLATCQQIIGNIKAGLVKLEGHMPTTPFAAKVRGK